MSPRTRQEPSVPSSCSTWLVVSSPPPAAASRLTSPRPPHEDTIGPITSVPRYTLISPQEPLTFNSIWSELQDGQRHRLKLQTTLGFPRPQCTANKPCLCGLPRSVSAWWEHFPAASLFLPFFSPSPLPSLDGKINKKHFLNASLYPLPSVRCLFPAQQQGQNRTFSLPLSELTHHPQRVCLWCRGHSHCSPVLNQGWFSWSCLCPSGRDDGGPERTETGQS